MIPPFFLFLISIAAMVIPGLAQENSKQEEVIFPEHIQPYKITLNDLVDTPWDARLSYGRWNWSHDQVLPPLSVTLKPGQDLIVFMSDARGFRCLDSSFLGTDRYHITGLVWDHIHTTHWGGWTHFIRGSAPLEEGNIEVSGGNPLQHNSGTAVFYRFKNHHSGQSTLTFYYCIFGDHCRDGDSQFNVKEITVTCQ